MAFMRRAQSGSHSVVDTPLICHVIWRVKHTFSRSAVYIRSTEQREIFASLSEVRVSEACKAEYEGICFLQNETLRKICQFPWRDPHSGWK